MLLKIILTLVGVLVIFPRGVKLSWEIDHTPSDESGKIPKYPLMTIGFVLLVVVVHVVLWGVI